MSNRSPHGSTRIWRTVRAEQLRRFPRCAICRRESAVEVDHIVQLKDGGARFDERNLRSLCQSCHVERHGGRKQVRIDAATGLPLPGQGSRHWWST